MWFWVIIAVSFFMWLCFKPVYCLREVLPDLYSLEVTGILVDKSVERFQQNLVTGKIRPLGDYPNDDYWVDIPIVTGPAYAYNILRTYRKTWFGIMYVSRYKK